ncbi:MAG: glycoside hydrolase family 97 protein [Candidatus Eisenbacteria bacterium]|nr:glycoside hydrolase family 97 protein [Candidatus Eisenbacteria bacterium]
MLSGVLLAVLAHASDAAPSGETLSSPDGRIRLVFSLDEGAPGYSVSRDGREVIRPSRLGYRLRGAPPLEGGFAPAGTSRRSFDEVWRPVWGKASEARNHYNELEVRLRESGPPGRELSIVFRAFDDGVAFRYRVPRQTGLPAVEIADELTEFRFAGDHTTWSIRADYESYEHLYREMPLSELGAANTPVTMLTDDGLFLSVHEAALTDYAGMTLAWLEGDPLGLRCELVPWPDGVKVRGETPLVSPWRTIQIGESPGDLVESFLILNLNEPCALEETSWIRPMKYMGIWWSLHIGKETWHEGPDHGATTENAERYIDFASDHGIPGLLIEGWNTGWDKWGASEAYDYVTPYPDFDLEEVVGYAAEKGVSIIGHHETGGDVVTYERKLEEALDLYARVGVPAVKTGYAGGIYPRGQHHHGQWMVRHYRRVVEEAARRRIMLDVHEPIKPTGVSRTYPNMMTREGVRGMEYNAWSEGNPPEHTTILPFTRMLAGPLDYTPGIFDLTFDEYKPGNRVHTTLVKQLALYVVLESPLQMAADLPENYKGQPPFGFIAKVPVTWDETRVLDAAIGDYAVFARRAGEAWYLGAVTDEGARVIRTPLAFLDSGRSYVLSYYADGADADWEKRPLSFEAGRAIVDQGTWLTLPLAAGGGYAAEIAPATEEEAASLPAYAPPF